MNYQKGEKYLNSILNRILLINSFNNPRLRSILAASSSNWDTSKHPKMGTAVFPNQDNDTLLKLMQLTPYITYENVVSALRAKSRLNNEPSKNELCDKFVKVYKDFYDISDGDEEISESDYDGYSVDDIDTLELAMDRLQGIMNKDYNEKLQRLQEQLQIANNDVADLIDEKNKMLKQYNMIDNEIARLTKPQSTNTDYDMTNPHADDDFLKGLLDAIKQSDEEENTDEEKNIDDNDEEYTDDNEEEDIDVEDKTRKEYAELYEEQQQLKEQKRAINSEKDKLYRNKDKSDETINRIQELDDKVKNLDKKINLLNEQIAPLEYLIRSYDKLHALYVRMSEIGTKITEAKQKAKKCKKNLRTHQEKPTPYQNQYQYTFKMSKEERQKSKYHIDAEAAEAEQQKNIKKRDDADNQVELLRSKPRLTEKEEQALRQYEQQITEANEKAPQLDKKLERARQELYKHKMQNIYELIRKLMQTGIYEENCPYAYACELVQNECGKVNNVSSNIEVNQSKSYQYMKYTNFQTALNKIANAMPSIYKEIIDDIYAKYSLYPAFRKSFDITDSAYNNLKMVTYTPVEEGQGNYVYDAESKTYKFDAENGNFKRTFTPLNTHTQISMSVPITQNMLVNFSKYTYTDDGKFKLDPNGEYIKVPKNLRYIYDSTSSSGYKPDINGNFIKLPNGQFQQISDGDFHKLPKEQFQQISDGDFYKFPKKSTEYKTQTVLENNNNFQRQINNTNYTFRQVGKGEKGNYIYNEKTKKYEYDPVNGNFVMVPSVDSQDKYVADGRLLSLTRQLVRFEYRNRTGYIDPILVTYYRGKYNNVEDSKYYVDYFFYELKKYIKWLEFIDEADPDRDIIDDNYKKHVQELLALKNAGKLSLEGIRKYINEKLDVGGSHDTFTAKELSNRNKADKNRLDASAIDQTSANNLKILHKYNYDLYKNRNHVIDPIMIAWAEFYHIYNAQRRNWIKSMNAMRSEFMKQKAKINEVIEAFKGKIKADIDNIPDGSTIPEMEKKQLIKKMLNIDLASIEDQFIDQDYRLARITQLREQYKAKAQDLLKNITKIKDDLHNNKTEFNYKTTLYRLQEAFYRQVNFFGDMLNEVRDTDTTGIAKRLIEPITTWQTNLEKILRTLDEYIKNNQLKNFNPAYYVDLLENCINKYGGGTKNYNPVNEDNYREIPELNTKWAEHTIEYELNKIFESYDTN